MDSVPRKLMQGLYLPALVGTGLVMTLLKIGEVELTTAIRSVQIGFGFLLVFYFSLSFLGNERVAEYRWSLFIVDMIETIAIFTAFYFLGYFSKGAPFIDRYFYLALSIPPALHLVWNKLAYGEVRPYLTIMTYLRLLLFGIGFLVGYLWIGYRILTFFSFLALTMTYSYLKFVKYPN